MLVSVDRVQRVAWLAWVLILGRGPTWAICRACRGRRYVQQNSVCHISGLERLEALDTLNISHNHISKLENLACCPMLRTLICTHNKLESIESVAHVSECTALYTLDLQNNNIKDPAILDVLKPLANLKCLYLKGNPVVSTMKNYRKTIIAALPSLTYLDERPVFEDERRIVNAWYVIVHPHVHRLHTAPRTAVRIDTIGCWVCYTTLAWYLRNHAPVSLLCCWTGASASQSSQGWCQVLWFSMRRAHGHA